MRDLPLNGFMWLEDERVKRNIRRVWRRLPACDRAVLRELVLEVRVGSDTDTGLGSVTPCNPNSMISGNAAEIAASDRWYAVMLAPSTAFKSDEAARFVIAYLFAQVILRHKQMFLVVENLLGLGSYTDDDLDALGEWNAEAAQLQAWLWGFRSEMAAFHAEFPDARRARWDVELEFRHARLTEAEMEEALLKPGTDAEM